MSLGLEEAARRAGKRLVVALAADTDSRALEVFSTNFPGALALGKDVTTLFPGAPGTSLHPDEEAIRAGIGRVDILVGGPPCQGHSDLNNRTRRSDPKNALYLRMARAAEALEPKVVVIENVVAVRHDNGRVVEKTRLALKNANYTVADRIVDLVRVGVPQRRRRHLLVASKISDMHPGRILEKLASTLSNHPERTVKWAINDLRHASNGCTFDSPSRTTEMNVRRIQYLFDHHLYDLPNAQRPTCHRNGDHSYVSIYGRLHWDRPAQTITTGFGSMGQGRYVHPSQRRTITPHEAARLQTFPDWFQFGDDGNRTALGSMIGNAVPPLLMVALGSLLISKLGKTCRSGEQT
jgi:DNA (cytosine-5)-methyltransferase 1